MIEHIETAVDMVGIEHVGVSTEYCFEYQDFLDELTANPGLFDESYTRWRPIQWMAPELLRTLGSALADLGWADDAITAVLSENLVRVARQVWPDESDR